jgi:four helix bundle protein
MKFNRFEEMNVWQKGQELNLLSYKHFSKSKDYWFVNQFLRACISITNNIAEGFERKSNKEFKQFLYVSKGSAGEVRSMLYLAKELKYIDESVFTQMFELSISISKMLSALIKTL